MNGLRLIKDSPFDWPDAKFEVLFEDEHGEYFPCIDSKTLKNVYLNGIISCIRGDKDRLDDLDKEIIKEYLFENAVEDLNGPYTEYFCSRMFRLEIDARANTNSILMTFALDGIKRYEAEILQDGGKYVD